MTAASATVCQRTTRPSARRSRGSKSNAMTAIGTVSEVYPRGGLRGPGTCIIRRDRGYADQRGGRPKRVRRPTHGGTDRTGRLEDRGVAMRHAAPTPGATLHVNLLGRLEARTAGGSHRPVVRPARPGVVRPARAVAAAAVARGHRRRPVARVGHVVDRRPATGPVARPARAGRRRRRARPRSSRSRRRRSASARPPRSTSTASPSRPASTGRAARRRPPIALYRGDLVEGLGHDCFAAERERLADRFEDALALVAERRLAVGRPRGGVRRGPATARARSAPRGGTRHPDRGPRPRRHALAGHPPVPTPERDPAPPSWARRRCPRRTRRTGWHCSAPSPGRATARPTSARGPRSMSDRTCSPSGAAEPGPRSARAGESRVASPRTARTPAVARRGSVVRSRGGRQCTDSFTLRIAVPRMRSEVIDAESV